MAGPSSPLSTRFSSWLLLCFLLAGAGAANAASVRGFWSLLHSGLATAPGRGSSSANGDCTPQQVKIPCDTLQYLGQFSKTVDLLFDALMVLSYAAAGCCLLLVYGAGHCAQTATLQQLTLVHSAGSVVTWQRCHPNALELEDSSCKVSAYIRDLCPYWQRRSCPVRLHK
jgi:hypothetical protein